ncbi:hypothetical protein H6P81_014519 [Aristolochia fimbriata]|uniref:Uncharacterized protein n=1 Tax=Aristolochia fimbriata TaxID=158543 RepID=A0AAV7EKJ3_ARIFI|nr:hypothetical protein H6P81_014519 [Aristolochia fimbriata]
MKAAAATKTIILIEDQKLTPPPIGTNRTKKPSDPPTPTNNQREQETTSIDRRARYAGAMARNSARGFRATKNRIKVEDIMVTSSPSPMAKETRVKRTEVLIPRHGSYCKAWS